MTEKQLRELIKQGEGQTLDFKKVETKDGKIVVAVTVPADYE